MVAAIPLMVCNARKIPPMGSRDAGSRYHASSKSFTAARCSLASARNSSAYCARSMLPEDALDGFQHARGLEGFDHEVLGPRLDGLDHQGLLPHGAAHEDFRGGIELHDLAHRIDAAHVGHDDVHRHQLRLE